MSGQLAYTLRVNGTEHDVTDAWLGESLLHVLRERLGLPGAKGACEQGECGSCSVLVDGVLVCACLVLAAAAVGREITTVEGLDEADPVLRAFNEAHAFQCGWCTPGFVLTVKAMRPEDDVREALGGNLCRCGCYVKIEEAVRACVS